VPGHRSYLSLGGRRVAGVLEKLSGIRELPEVITVDKEPKFDYRALDEWAYLKGVKLNFILTFPSKTATP
jgi:putative transposase